MTDKQASRLRELTATAAAWRSTMGGDSADF